MSGLNREWAESTVGWESGTNQAQCQVTERYQYPDVSSRASAILDERKSPNLLAPKHVLLEYQLLGGSKDLMITIVDYQMGNLRSVQKGIEKVGGEAKISSDPQEIATADKLILPGVGAFKDAIDEIRRRDLESAILEFIDSGKPFLGICLGLQLLFERGLENGEHRGLGVFAGDVIRFDIDANLKVPHMGWNTVTKKNDSPLIQHIEDGTHFYFVHSYHVKPADDSIIALECDYGGPFCAMVWKDNVFATQFHPEKSQANGLSLLDHFAKLPNEAIV